MSDIRRWIVWSNHGYDGWHPEGFDTFEDAVKGRDHALAGSSEVIITEHVPLKVIDGRTVPA